MSIFHELLADAYLIAGRNEKNSSGKAQTLFTMLLQPIEGRVNTLLD